MNLYKGMFKSYNINDLSDKAKEKAYSNWLASETYYPWGDDNEHTLKEFSRIFDVKVKSWSYDMNTYDYRIQDIAHDWKYEEVSGIRLAAYVWNNYSKYILKGKYYSTDLKYIDGKAINKSRHSKINQSLNGCNLTGYYTDDCILEPIIKCLHYKEMFNSYEDLIKDCLETFFQACQKEVENYYSYENFLEDAKCNEWEYDIYGNNFHLPNEFIETA